MMKKLLAAFFSFVLFASGTVIGQARVWSLEECIKHAIDNNIQIKQQEIQTKFQQNSLDLSKLKLLPSINGSASHNYSFGRALDETTYQFTEEQTVQSNNFYIGGSLNLFSGLVNYNTIQKNKYEVLAGQQELQNIKDNVALSVALAYLQILLNKELVLATGSQLEITIQQIEKTQKLVDAGSLARGNLLEIQAQASKEELQLITLKNQLDISLLNLTQLLELQTTEGFDVAAPVLVVDTNEGVSGNVNDIYATSEPLRPEIKSAELKLTAREYDLKTAVGGRSPRLSLSNSFSTGYSDIRKKLLGIDPAAGPVYGKYSFGDQLNDNINYGIGFSLSIPILNGWQVNKNIQNSKLNIENSSYALDASKKQLYKNIQQAYTDATAALKKYDSSIKAVESMQEAFRYSEQKFDVGMVTSVEYNASKSSLLNAQSQLAQAKYEYVFKTKVLDFYKGLPLSLGN
jgi:outer membrane protein